MQESAHIMHVEGTRSIDPPSEHDLCTRIGYQRRPKMQGSGTRRIVRQFDIIRHDDVSQHGFQVVCSKEPSRANIIQSVIFVVVGNKDHTMHAVHVQRTNTRSSSRRIHTSHPHPPLLASRQIGRARMHGRFRRMLHYSVWIEQLPWSWCLLVQMYRPRTWSLSTPYAPDSLGWIIRMADASNERRDKYH